MSVVVMLADHIYILTVGQNNIGVPLAGPTQRTECHTKTQGPVLTSLVRGGGYTPIYHRNLNTYL